jgi:hypothetical protein
MFSWDVITVGKVLAEIHEAIGEAVDYKAGAQATLANTNGILVRGKDYRGTFYRIAINRDTIRVAHGVREDLMELAEQEMVLRARNDHTRRLTSPLDESKTLRNLRPDWTSVDPAEHDTDEDPEESRTQVAV